MSTAKLAWAAFMRVLSDARRGKLTHRLKMQCCTAPRLEAVGALSRFTSALAGASPQRCRRTCGVTVNSVYNGRQSRTATNSQYAESEQCCSARVHILLRQVSWEVTEWVP